MIRIQDTKDRRILSQYNLDGITVTICKPAKARKSEKTWRGASKYSMANLGGKAVSLRNAGLNHAKG
jgi:spore germination protein YaaH